VTNASIWGSSATPAVESAADPNAIELGVKFRSDLSGYITGIRFYKGSLNTGTHVGHLWDLNGTLLATVSFTNESATGWQQAELSLPVAINANTTYVVSYYAPNGGYAYTHGYFENGGAGSGPLHALANGENGGNALYVYGTGGGFPTQSYLSTNYWVDVVFSQSLGDFTPPTVTARTPGIGATNVAADANVTATFSENVQTSTITFQVRDSASNLIPGVLTYDAATKTATFNPNQNLGALQTYTVTISGAKDAAGNTMASVTWTFTTAGVWNQSSVSEFSSGTGVGVVVTNEGGGALQLASSLQEEFNGTSLDSTWATGSWTSQGGGTTSIAVSDGALSLAGGHVMSTTSFINKGVEASINFAANPYQHFGLATGLDQVVGRYWAIFSTGGTNNQLFARVNASGSTQDIDLGALPTGFHTYKIQPVPTGFQFYVDGVLLTTVTVTFPANTPLQIAFSSFNGAPAMQADWVRLSDYNATGTFTSAVFDAGQTVNWQTINWTAYIPTGTSVKVEISLSDDNNTWTEWAEVLSGVLLSNKTSRYIRYRVTLTTNDPTVTPVFYDINILFA
jgi:hypothetical protein